MYRFTDKISLLILKTLSLVMTLLAEGLAVIIGSGGAEKRGLLGIITRLLGVFSIILVTVGAVILGITRRLLGTTARLAGGAAVGVTRASGRSVNTAMARRSARVEMDAGIREDPLRVQNRILSALFVITLIALIGIVLWATRPTNDPLQGISVVNVNPITSGADIGSTEEAVSLAIATAIPTATQLPEVLQARGSIAYSVRENGQTDLWVANVGGNRNPVRITNDLADERDPAWSQDGRKLAYASNRDGNWELYIYDLITGATNRMTYDLSFQGAPRWSPDGAWLIYENYLGNNLDVYVLPVLDPNQQNTRLPTSSEWPDFAPDWSQNDGRNLLFVSWRDGNQDIYLTSLDTPETAINLTNTPERHEDTPMWSPDGSRVVYAARDGGIDKIFVKSVADLDAGPELIGVGKSPTWSPDGNAILAVVETIDATHFTAYPYNSNGIPQVIAAPLGADQVVWTEATLPANLLNGNGLPLRAPALYTEQERAFEGSPPFILQPIRDVDVAQSQLSDRVNDSFNAMRERVVEKSGEDFLGRLDDAWWPLGYRPQAGEPVCNWHLTGRAFSVNRASAIVGFPKSLEVIRENTPTGTQWRLYLRVSEDGQSGQLGEPLRFMPWDFNSRNSGDVIAYEQGGRFYDNTPVGYYVDLTQIAADFGWQGMTAADDWRANTNGINYWMFIKPTGLNWVEAMLELYNESQLGGCAPRRPTPAPSATPGA
jgi:hypothetical protein